MLIPVTLIIVVLFLLFFIINRDEKDINDYIKNYSSKKRASPHKVVVSINMINSFDDCRNTVLSILNQDSRIDEIIINSPSHLDLPSDLSKVCTLFVTRDYGQYNKLIPTILKERESETIIICVESGIIYEKDFIDNTIQHIDNGNVVLSDRCTCVKAGHIDTAFIEELDVEYNTKLQTYFKDYNIVQY
jgi:hypothetical protein